MVEEKDFSEELAIDPYTLEEDCLQQPGLYRKYSLLFEEAQVTLHQKEEQLSILKTETKDDLERTYAELYNQAVGSKEPETIGLVKSTVDAVKSWIMTHKEYITAQDYWNTERERLYNEYLEARSAVGWFRSALESIKQRRDQLGNLVQLWHDQYYVGPPLPRDIPAGKRYGDRQREAGTNQQRAGLNKDGKRTRTA